MVLSVVQLRMIAQNLLPDYFVLLLHYLKLLLVSVILDEGRPERQLSTVFGDGAFVGVGQVYCLFGL